MFIILYIKECLYLHWGETHSTNLIFSPQIKNITANEKYDQSNNTNAEI